MSLFWGLGDLWRRLPGASRIVLMLVGGGGLIGVLHTLGWLGSAHLPAVSGILFGVVIIYYAIRRVLMRIDRKRGQSFGARLYRRMFRPRPPVDESQQELDSRKVLEEKWTRVYEELAARRYTYYDFPWYLIIGASQSGKTTTIQQALTQEDFPIGDKPVVDFGGTKGCNWFFTNQAILIDTAGRYIDHLTEEAPEAGSVAAQSREEWTTFLELLCTHRERNPINGVILVVKLEDAIDQDEQRRARTVRTMLLALRDIEARLHVRVPVHLMVTMCDHMVGFVDFFAGLSELNRHGLFGWSRQGPFEAPPDEGEVRAGLGQVAHRVDEMGVRLLEAEAERGDLSQPGILRRDRIACFPDEFRALLPLIDDLIASVFAASAFHDAHFLRGVYFSSGLQQGVPAVHACRELVGDQALKLEEEDVALLTPQSRPYFIKDFYCRKVFAESGLVSLTTREASRRNRATVAAAWTAAGILVFLGGYFAFQTQDAHTAARRIIDDFRIAAGLKEASSGQADRAQAQASFHDKWVAVLAVPPSAGAWDDVEKQGKRLDAELWGALVLVPKIEELVAEQASWQRFRTLEQAQEDMKPLPAPDRAKPGALCSTLGIAPPAEPFEFATVVGHQERNRIEDACREASKVALEELGAVKPARQWRDEGDDSWRQHRFWALDHGIAEQITTLGRVLGENEDALERWRGQFDSSADASGKKRSKLIRLLDQYEAVLDVTPIATLRPHVWERAPSTLGVEIGELKSTKDAIRDARELVRHLDGLIGFDPPDGTPSDLPPDTEAVLRMLDPKWFEEHDRIATSLDVSSDEYERIRESALGRLGDWLSEGVRSGEFTTVTVTKWKQDPIQGFAGEFRKHMKAMSVADKTLPRNKDVAEIRLHCSRAFNEFWMRDVAEVPELRPLDQPFGELKLEDWNPTGSETSTYIDSILDQATLLGPSRAADWRPLEADDGFDAYAALWGRLKEAGAKKSVLKCVDAAKKLASAVNKDTFAHDDLEGAHGALQKLRMDQKPNHPLSAGFVRTARELEDKLKEKFRKDFEHRWSAWVHGDTPREAAAGSVGATKPVAERLRELLESKDLRAFALLREAYAHFGWKSADDPKSWEDLGGTLALKRFFLGRAPHVELGAGLVVDGDVNVPRDSWRVDFGKRVDIESLPATQPFRISAFDRDDPHFGPATEDRTYVLGPFGSEWSGTLFDALLIYYGSDQTLLGSDVDAPSGWENYQVSGSSASPQNEEPYHGAERWTALELRRDGRAIGRMSFKARTYPPLPEQVPRVLAPRRQR